MYSHHQIGELSIVQPCHSFESQQLFADPRSMPGNTEQTGKGCCTSSATHRRAGIETKSPVTASADQQNYSLVNKPPESRVAQEEVDTSFDSGSTIKFRAGSCGSKHFPKRIQALYFSLQYLLFLLTNLEVRSSKNAQTYNKPDDPHLKGAAYDKSDTAQQDKFIAGNPPRCQCHDPRKGACEEHERRTNRGQIKGALEAVGAAGGLQEATPG
ncbi:hypothetical protein [Pseudonocardia sp. ICBG601]|uniref:hypothetical protein n=1 Tax=Pseudonocardia sp. ICBG601 TaxID=2846759 RepID=UPI001CF66D1C|nr:hypothetical protein [Pseudonocardia sp. ICBG601]